MSRRILHIIDTLEPSGAARQLLWLAQGLVEQGIDVHLCALARGGSLLADLRAARFPVTLIGRRWAVDPLAYRRLARHVARLRPEVVHTWDHRSGVYGRLAVRSLGRKKVSGTFFSSAAAKRALWKASGKRFLTPFSRPVLVAGAPRVDPWLSSLDWLVQRRLARGTGRLVVPHGAVCNWCIRHGLPGDRLVVLPGGVPPARRSDVSRDQLLRELNLPADARLVGVVGCLVPDKRVKDLIWATDLLRVLHDNLRLLIIGDGPELPQLQRFARLASDLEHVHFLGPRDDLWRILPHLDVLWNGSERAGYATAVMEAMAAGVPVVASDVPGHRELVDDGKTGYLVPIAGRAARARTTDRLLDDAGLAARIGKAGRQKMFEQFSVGQVVQRHVEMYRALLPG